MHACVCMRVCDFRVGVRGLRLRIEREPLPLGVVLGLVLASGVGAERRRASSGQRYLIPVCLVHVLFVQCSRLRGCTLNMAAE